MSEYQNYVPSDEEVKLAEESMTDEQKQLTRERIKEDADQAKFAELREMGQKEYFTGAVALASKLVELCKKRQPEVIKEINDDATRYNFVTERREIDFNDKWRQTQFDQMHETMNYLDNYKPMKEDEMDKDPISFPSGWTDGLPRFWVLGQKREPHYSYEASGNPMYPMNYLVIDKIMENLDEADKRMFELIKFKKSLETKIYQHKNAEDIVDRQMKEVAKTIEGLKKSTEDLEKLGVDLTNPSVFEGESK